MFHAVFDKHEEWSDIYFDEKHASRVLARHWGMNMVGMVQTNRSGVEMAETVKKRRLGAESQFVGNTTTTHLLSGVTTTLSSDCQIVKGWRYCRCGSE